MEILRFENKNWFKMIVQAIIALLTVLILVKIDAHLLMSLDNDTIR